MPIHSRIAGGVLVALASALGWFILWAEREDLEFDGFAWVWRSKYYGVRGDGCQSLDRILGSHARSPRKLLEVLRWQYQDDPARNPHGLGYPEFFEVQHQALVRLLAIQGDTFGVSVPPQPAETLQADHAGAHVEVETNTSVMVIGSASVYPDVFDQHPWEGYFRYDVFHFDKNGRLHSRQPLPNNEAAPP